MRATMHNGRAGKSGVFLARHNDRDFDVSMAEHIRKDQSANNWTWHWQIKDRPDMTFEEAEKSLYDRMFSESLEAQNERHRKSRHHGRVKTMDDYRTDRNTCPEETIIQIGNKDDTVPADLLKRIAIEQINWESRTFPNVIILDAALHVDEEGAPHFHKRQVWIAKSDDGCVVSQSKALQQMGIERPDTTRKKSRYNNPKMEYTRRCREHFLDLCREHGLEIETDPKEASKTGLSLLEYQRRQEEEKLAEIEKKQADLKEAWNTKVTQANKVIAERAVRQNERENELNARESALDDLKTGLQAREGLLRANEVEQQARQTELNALQSDLNERESSLRDREIKAKALYLSAEKKENDLKAQETALKALNEKLQANKAILTRKTQMIDRQASDLTARESDLTAREFDLAVRASDLDDRQKELLEILKKQMKRVGKLSEIELRMFKTISDRAESTDNLDDLEMLIRALDQTKEGQTL